MFDIVWSQMFIFRTRYCWPFIAASGLTTAYVFALGGFSADFTTVCLWSSRAFLVLLYIIKRTFSAPTAIHFLKMELHVLLRLTKGSNS